MAAMRASGFKPLQSGALDRTAVVAKPYQDVRHLVSNPFRAGHWIVPTQIFKPSKARRSCFKPLQSGALDRTNALRGLERATITCFKPLQSGALDRRTLWRSSPPLPLPRFKPLQSGALDRSGRRVAWTRDEARGFKPLQSGALDRRLFWARSKTTRCTLFQTPSERGIGS